MKVKEIFNKVELWHITIGIFIILSTFFVYYQYSSTVPKKTNIDIKEIKELQQSNIQIENIDNKKKKVTCKIDTKYLSEKEYTNYVIGKGVARAEDCSIIMKVGDEYYKIKSLSEGKSNDKVDFVGCVRTNHLVENCEIMLYDNESKTLYKYVGGQSE